MTRSRNGKSHWLAPALGAFVVLALLIFGRGIAAQDEAKPATPATAPKPRKPWVAPDSERDVKNPVPVNAKTLAEGAKLFHENCEPCHGEKGMGDGDTGKSLPTKPANFTDAKLMSLETDGTLYWKMSTGRSPMPSWEDELKDEERWELVNYIRQLGKNAAANNK